MRLAGVVCPIATPTRANGSLADDVLRSHIGGLIAEIDGIFVLGSSGEMPALDDSVAREVVAVAVDAIGGRVPLLVGVGDESTSRTLRKLERLAIDGVDFVVCAPPAYFPASDAALVQHFSMLASQSPAPLVLYNIPQNTGCILSASAVADLAEHPRIVAIKDSAGDMFAFAQLLEIRSPEFSVLQGREQLMAASYLLGADGVVSALANFAPRLLRTLEQQIRDHENEAARHTQREVTRLAQVFEHGYWLAALKAALATCGLDAGDPIAPLDPCTAEEVEAVQGVLADTDQRWLMRWSG